MKWLRIVLAAAVGVSAGCARDDGRSRFNLIDLFFPAKDPRESLPPGHPDRVVSLSELRKQGYGYESWDDLKNKFK